MNVTKKSRAMTQNAREACLVSIVDDDEGVRHALGNLLESAGLNVERFASAEEYVDSVHANKKSCLILDIHLPRMNGLELQHRLSGDGNPVRIIFITAHADEYLREKALQAGAVGFFHKPFNSEALLEAVLFALR
jgi:FixJ family two-component response regulator